VNEEMEKHIFADGDEDFLSDEHIIAAVEQYELSTGFACDI